MIIYVKTVSGKSITLEVEPTDKIQKLKDRLIDLEGIHVCDQKLLISGKYIEEEKTFEDYNIGKESTLHLMK